MLPRERPEAEGPKDRRQTSGLRVGVPAAGACGPGYSPGERGSTSAAVFRLIANSRSELVARANELSDETGGRLGRRLEHDRR